MRTSCKLFLVKEREKRPQKKFNGVCEAAKPSLGQRDLYLEI